ncbi:MAG: DUF2062 domain-containing protein [Carboxydocellales bacterium]
MRLRLRRYFRYHYFKILRLKDSPSKIAKGVSLGVALDFLPLPFISIPLAWVVAKLAHFNTIAAVMTAIALKPAVFTIFFPFNVLVGGLLLGDRTPVAPPPMVPVPEPNLSWESITNFFAIDTLKVLGPSFLVGSIINAVVWSLVVYLFLNRTLVFRHQSRLNRKFRRQTSSSLSKCRERD